jgi:hypothetical protein
MPFFTVEGSHIFWSKKEGTFNSLPWSEEDNNGVGDGDGGAYQHLPMKLSSGYIANSKPLFVAMHCHGQGSDYAYLKRHGREKPIRLTLTGELWNFNMLYQMCKACTTGEAVEDVYPHEVDTTDTRGTPSFQLYMELDHDTDPIAWEFMGCIITKWSISWSLNNTVQLSIDIECASQNLVDDSSYHYIDTNIPAMPTTSFYSSDLLTLTWKKGGTAIDGKFRSFKLTWNDNYKIERYHGDANLAIKKGPREIDVEFEWEPTDTESHDEAVAAVTDRDIDISCYLIRTADSDECKIELEKLAWKDYEVGDISEYTWKQNHVLIMNPNETGKKITITQKNALTNAFYEGA